MLLIKNQHNGKKLKHLKGVGAKICYKELDQQLIKWFTSKLTNPNDEQLQTPTENRKRMYHIQRLITSR